MRKISFNNKVENSGSTSTGRVFASDINEIKEVVNENSDLASTAIINLQNEVTLVDERISALQGNLLGGIAFNAVAPTPKVNGRYVFTSSGSCTWITDGATIVAINDEVLVTYVAPSTYIYTYLQVTSNYVPKTAVKQATGTSTTNVMSQKAITDALVLKADKSYVDNQDATKVSKTGDETINDVKTFQSSPIVPTPTNGNDAVNKTYADTKIAKDSITPDFGTDTTKVISQKGYTDDMKAWLPSSVYSDRVAADSGSIKDKIGLFDSYKTALNLLPNTLLAYSPEMGIKQSVSGLVYKATKLYDLSNNNNDGSQSTAANQPYIGGNVAPNERMWLWGSSKTMAFTPISFNATDKWSVSIVADIVGSSADFIGSLNTRITFNNAATDSITFKNESATSVSLNVSKFGGTRRIYLVSQGNGIVQVWVNGFLQGSITNQSNVTLNTIYSSLNAKGKSIRVFNKDLSKSEIEGLDKFLASIYPDHETTAIGSQAWLTSNHIGNVTSDGFIIPEVQGNDAASNPELLTNGNYESGLIGTMNNSTGGATATYTLNTINPISGTQDGRLQVTAVGTSGARPLLSFGASTLMQSGKKYKVKLDYKVNSGICIISNIYDGSLFAINKTLTGTGTLELWLFMSSNWELALYFDGRNLFDLQIDNLSVKEAGWADAQLLYDISIGAGRSSLEATKAAAMWCKYNNSDDNAAVYGYILNGHAHNYFKNTVPKGLRLGLNNDWTQLFTTLGGNSIAGKKLKKEGIVYWSTTNSGTNESGFTAIGGGRRNADGTFANIGTEATFRAADGNVISLLNNSDAVTSTSADLRIGTSLRFLKNAPVAESQNIIRTTGKFPTDIVSGAKSIQIPFGFRVTSIVITSSTNLTNIEAKLFDAAGVERTLLLTQKVCNSTSLIFQVLGDQPILLQDPTVRVTAKNNGGDGMTIDVLATQVIF